MSASFEQLLGAAADVRELEYVAALHQTDQTRVRNDGSIKAEDIQFFLSSRYGIIVDEEDVKNCIMSSLGGGDEGVVGGGGSGSSTEQQDDEGRGGCCQSKEEPPSADGDVLDLMEIVAMLLIPTFLKAAHTDTGELTEVEFESIIQMDPPPAKEKEEPPKGVGDCISWFLSGGCCKMNDSSPEQKKIEQSTPFKRSSITGPPTTGLELGPQRMLDYVLKMILFDVTKSSTPKTLSPALIAEILVAYGEHSLAQDTELVNKMYEAAIDPSDNNATPVLNVEAFARALTHDVLLYDIRNENRRTTNFNDVVFTEQELDEREEAAIETVKQDPEGRDSELIEVSRYYNSLRNMLARAEHLEQVDTIPAIDIRAGTYRSKGLLVMLFSTIMITWFAYFSNFDTKVLEKCTEIYDLSYAWNSPWEENTDVIACEALGSIINWLVFFLGLSAFGVIGVTIGSIGNDVVSKEGWKPLVGIAAILLFVTVPYFVRRSITSSEEDRQENTVLYFASLVFALITCFFHLSHALALIYSTDLSEEFRKRAPYVASHPILKSTVSEEQGVKKATAIKLTQMLENAMTIQKSKDLTAVPKSHHGQALKQYETEGKRFRTAGGFWWAWREIFGSNQTFARDGIWVPARMISANIAQYVVAFYVALGGFYLATDAAENYDIEWAKRHISQYIDRAFEFNQDSLAVLNATANVTSIVTDYLTVLNETYPDISKGCAIPLSAADSLSATDLLLSEYCTGTQEVFQCDFTDATDVNVLCPLLDPTAAQSLNASTTLALLSASGFETESLQAAAYEAAQQAAYESVDNLYPTDKYMITIPLYVATVIAFLMALSLAVIYIPSTVNTMLRLRCGDIPTLRNKDFHRYRNAPDLVSQLTGSLFWGSLFSSVLVGGVIGLIIFFFLWQGSVYYAQRVVAILCGIVSVVIVRQAIVCSCRCTQYKSFYRKHPASANISILALEWGSFALSAAWVIVRSVKLLLASATFIGRVDTPFLAHNVGRIGPLELDSAPIIHMKEILSHEAHRHPYIEQLGVIYLMKLRYSDDFGNRAGTCWRLLFVYALMPWLSKYRITARPGNEQNDVGKLQEHYPSASFAVSLRNLATEDKDVRMAELDSENQWLQTEYRKLQEKLARDTKETVALYNYETFHGLTHGTATVDMVAMLPEGIDGWADGGGKRTSGKSSRKKPGVALSDLQPVAPPEEAFEA
ncbi:expressed unknown protein [Seminavis robusta]|uniref:Uncharacterized protein n=1 Tax=Seminavis robusta TaxID=568900 RepID=A0A9N8HJC5_9STRA|nr:expressed unknown protein [Seminavis robusta]|eukprot:Sro684_g186790.1 n/a (1206) ;mRNA; f:32311-36601